MTSVLSHVIPYALFVALAAATPHLPDSVAPHVDVVRAVAAGAALLVFARRGAYAELRPGPSRVRGATLFAVAVGLAAGAVWVPLAEAAPMAFGSRGGFDAASASPLHWAGRLLGSLIVVPLAEELFVRSCVPRFVDAGDRPWTEAPIGRFSPLAVAVSLGFFTLSHPEWLAALVVGALLTLLLAATGRLRDAVLAHAIANATLAAWVIVTGETQWW